MKLTFFNSMVGLRVSGLDPSSERESMGGMRLMVLKMAVAAPAAFVTLSMFGVACPQGEGTDDHRKEDGQDLPSINSPGDEEATECKPHGVDGKQEEEDKAERGANGETALHSKSLGLHQLCVVPEQNTEQMIFLITQTWSTGHSI